MGYLLEKLFGEGFKKGLKRHLIVWETLHFQGFNMDMAFERTRSANKHV